jgi:hypothetical protein
MRLPKDIDIQLSGNYRGPMLQPQGQMNPSYSMDVAFKKSLWKDKASIALRASDIFNTQSFDVEQSGEGFTFHHVRKRDSRTIMFSFTYKINEGIKQKGRKRDSGGSGMEERDME